MNLQSEKCTVAKYAIGGRRKPELTVLVVLDVCLSEAGDGGATDHLLALISGLWPMLEATHDSAAKMTCRLPAAAEKPTRRLRLWGSPADDRLPIAEPILTAPAVLDRRVDATFRTDPDTNVTTGHVGLRLRIPCAYLRDVAVSEIVEILHADSWLDLEVVQPELEL